MQSPKTYNGLDDGPHTFKVRATDDARQHRPGRRAHVDGRHDAAHDHDRGQACQAHAGPDRAGSPSTRTSRSIASSARSAATSSSRSTPCTSPHVLEALADGDYVFRVRAVDKAATRRGRRVRVDRRQRGADDDDHGRPQREHRSQQRQFSFDADEPVDRFECRRDEQADWHECASPHDYADLGVGAHVFRVRAIDKAGNEGGVDTREWTIVDNDAAHDDDRPTSPPSTRRTGPRRFTFDANEPVDRFECKLGGDELIPFATCASPHVLDALADGDYVFRVRAVDRAGNSGEPDNYEWNVDNAAADDDDHRRPQRDHDVPERARSASTPTSRSSATSAGATTRPDWHPCTSPHDYVDLGLGDHVFRVRAVDRAGNEGAVATRDWTIVAPPPSCTPRPSRSRPTPTAGSSRARRSRTTAASRDAKVTTKANDNARTVVRFPLPDMPAGCVVTDAKLRLFANREDRPDPRGHPPRGGLAGARDHLAQPARRRRATPPRAPRARTGSSGPSPGRRTRLYNDGNHGFLVRDKVESNGGAEQGFNTRERRTAPPAPGRSRSDPRPERRDPG